MFLDINEMDTVIAEYKLNEITDSDPYILQVCINAAVSRVSSYLRIRYDAEKIFSKTGDDRNPDILEICKNVALWNLIRRNNVDILYSRVKEIYDRDMAYLKEIASGSIATDLPVRTDESGESISAFRSGSNPKFIHSW